MYSVYSDKFNLNSDRKININRIDKMENDTNEKYHVSIGHGSWLNKVKQNTDNSKPGNTSFWKILAAILSAFAAIASILVALLKFNIIQLPQ